MKYYFAVAKDCFKTENRGPYFVYFFIKRGEEYLYFIMDDERVALWWRQSFNDSRQNIYWDLIEK